MNKGLEVRFINAVKGKWGIFSKGDFLKHIDEANQALKNIPANVKKSNPEGIAAMEKAVKKLEDLKVPEKFEIKNKEIGPEFNQFLDDYLERLSDFFDVMYKNEKILPDYYREKTITKTYKEFIEMANLRIYASESLEFATELIGKNADDIGKHFDEWMEIVKKPRQNSAGGAFDAKKIVDEVMTARSPGELSLIHI